MRYRLAAAAAAFLFAFSVSFAADKGAPMGKIAAPAAQAQEPDKWNRAGPYVGILGAYDAYILQEEGGLDLAAGKLMAGGFAGYNFRCGTLVCGVEGDWLFTGISASSAAGELSVKASTQHLASLRLRAGVPLGPALLYVTAGPAFQHAKTTVNDDTSGGWRTGAAFGGGAEVELSRTLFVRLEALHYVFPEDGWSAVHEWLDSQNQHTTARVGVGFKLN
jgi:opacity protein-like surface antigen